MTGSTTSKSGALILGGSHGSLEIARSLGRRGIPVWLITSDNPLPTLSRYLKRYFLWAGPNSHGAVGYLTDLVIRNGLKGWVLFAGGDAEVQFIAQNQEALGALFTLTTSNWDVIRFAIDKRSMNERATELGLALPRSCYPRTRADLAGLGLRFPVVIKPTVSEGRHAFVGVKAWRADDPHALAARYDQAEALVGADRIMVQELIPGDGRTQFSYAGVWNRGTSIGSLVARRRRQYPVDFGFTSTFVETLALKDVEDAASRFLKSLDYSGLVEIEFKYDVRDQLYKIIDFNARAWTWIALGAAAGVDFSSIQWQLARGEAVKPQAARSNVTWRYLSRDLFAAIQEMLLGTLTPADYLRSLHPSSTSAIFAWDDMLPAALDLPVVAARLTKRHFIRRNCDRSVTPESARSRA